MNRGNVAAAGGAAGAAPTTRTARIAAELRTRAADARERFMSRHGLPADAPLAAAFVAPLKTCCPPQEGLREVEEEQATLSQQAQQSRCVYLRVAVVAR